MLTDASFDEAGRAAQTQFVRDRYRQFVLHGVPPKKANMVKVVIGIVMCFTLVGIPHGIWLIITGFWPSYPRQVRQELKFIDDAEAVLAAPIMVNTRLRKTDPAFEAFPGLFLITFDPLAGSSLKTIADAALAFEPDAGISATSRERLAQMLLDETFRSKRRRPLPVDIANGRPFYAVDLAVPNWYLPERCLSDDVPFIACLAETGKSGKTRAVPYWIAAHDIEPPPYPAMYQVYLGP